ncbi:unnamed protein product [Rhodiola kirilowii]
MSHKTKTGTALSSDDRIARAPRGSDPADSSITKLTSLARSEGTGLGLPYVSSLVATYCKNTSEHRVGSETCSLRNMVYPTLSASFCCSSIQPGFS